VDTQKINDNPSIKAYCHNNDCKTNEERINALIAYLFKEFKKSINNHDYNDYDEYLLMWVSDKLFKIRNESKEKKPKPPYMDTITLNNAYEKHLKDHKVKLDYWYLLGIIPGLKEANLRYMAEFYLLLNNICKTIADYNDNGAESPKLSKYSKNCLNQYQNLYINISECKSYLHLLNKLKGIYDDFRNSAINKNGSKNNLATNLKKLTKPNGEEMNAVKGFKSYNFSDLKCKGKKKNPKPKKEDSLPLQPTKLESTSSSPPLTPSPEMQKQDSLSPSQSPEQPNDQLSEQKDSDNDRDGTDSDSVEDGSQSTEGDPFNTGPLIFSIALKGTGILNGAITSFEKIKERITEGADTIKNLYNTSLTNLEGIYNEYSSFLNEIINNISTDPKQVDSPADSDDSKSGSDGEVDEQSPTQKDSHQTLSDTPQLHQEPSGKVSSDQTGQGGPEKPVDGTVITSEDPGSEVKGNGTIGIGDIFIFKEYKKIGIPIIVIIISITLAIMYKYLVFDRRKKLKRKKMKNVPNLFGVNKTT
ncbi:CIR protein, partial [Plasmodium chabaudi chabaudi]